VVLVCIDLGLQVCPGIGHTTILRTHEHGFPLIQPPAHSLCGLGVVGLLTCLIPVEMDVYTSCACCAGLGLRVTRSIAQIQLGWHAFAIATASWAVPLPLWTFCRVVLIKTNVLYGFAEMLFETAKLLTL
jgi:hypothetical protein